MSALLNEVHARIREELLRRADDIDDASLNRVTITVSFDKRTRHVGSIRWLPEFEHVIPKPERVT